MVLGMKEGGGNTFLDSGLETYKLGEERIKCSIRPKNLLRCFEQEYLWNM